LRYEFNDPAGRDQCESNGGAPSLGDVCIIINSAIRHIRGQILVPKYPLELR